ncbi:MAG: sulfatase-like hydrolase/transferase [Isosphaeraceae bacterium]
MMLETYATALPGSDDDLHPRATGSRTRARWPRGRANLLFGMTGGRSNDPAPPTRPARILTHALLAALMAVMLFARQIVHLETPHYRVFFRPGPGYRLAILADVAVLTLVATAAAALLCRARPRGLFRAYQHLYLFMLSFGLLSLVPGVENRPALTAAAWVGCGALSAASLALGWTRPVRAARALGLILSPTAAIVLLRLTTWDEPPAIAPLPAVPQPTSAASNAPPVYLVVFDGWSYDRATLSDGQIDPAFVNLSRLARRSFEFRRAHSESTSTAVSIPHLLFETRSVLDFEGTGFRLTSEDGRVAPVTSDTPNLFRAAGQHGLTTAAVGWHIPYTRLFHGSLDACAQPRPWPGVSGFGGQMLRALLENLRYSYDPVVRVARRLMVVREHQDRTEDLRLAALRLLSEGPERGFSFIHASLPHEPLIYHPDAPPNHFSVGSTPTDYRDQSYIADRFLGEILDRIEARGVLDEALIVVTSDHGWREETDPSLRNPPEKLLHVPLLVKWPRQQTPEVVNTPFLTTHLGRLIRQALDGADQPRADELINELDR